MIIDDILRDRLREVLESAFPSAKGQLADADIDAFGHALGHKLIGQEHDLGMSLPHTPPTLTSPNVPDVPYYLALATHDRPAKGTPDASAPYEQFVGHLPCVRVQLGLTDANPITTKMGTIEPNDHLVFSVKEINEQFATALGYSATRVDLITPPRLEGTRFGAISIFLGYRDAAAAPTFFLLEAGMATGQAERLYFGQTIDTTIVAQSGYQPTPFSSPNNTYLGNIAIKMAAGDPGEIDSLHVEARNSPSGPSYIKLAVSYQRQPQPVMVWPALITAEAALRVAAIGYELGMDVPFGPLTPAAAEIALHTLPWLRPPSS